MTEISQPAGVVHIAEQNTRLSHEQAILKNRFDRFVSMGIGSAFVNDSDEEGILLPVFHIGNSAASLTQRQTFSRNLREYRVKRADKNRSERYDDRYEPTKAVFITLSGEALVIEPNVDTTKTPGDELEARERSYVYGRFSQFLVAERRHTDTRECSDLYNQFIACAEDFQDTFKITKRGDSLSGYERSEVNELGLNAIAFAEIYSREIILEDAHHEASFDHEVWKQKFDVMHEEALQMNAAIDAEAERKRELEKASFNESLRRARIEALGKQAVGLRSKAIVDEDNFWDKGTPNSDASES